MVRDDSLLDTPPSTTVWLLFAGMLILSTLMTALWVISPEAGILLFIIVGVPAWLLGFSIPVLAWWSYSTKAIGLHTRQRDAEAWLVAGMISTIPALAINSLFFPAIFGNSISAEMLDILITVISAPVGEELCKAALVMMFYRSIISPRHGFQVGFTVGLGFAMLENLTYVLGAAFGGPFSFTITVLLRGIGSIPGHAFWTGLTGAGIGWWLMQSRAAKAQPVTSGETTEAAQERGPEWKLLDPKTGQFVESVEEQPVVDDDPHNIAHLLGEFESRVVEPVEEMNPILWKVSLPKNPLVGLLLAMLGHASWNGSLTLMDVLANALGWSDTTTILAQLLLMIGLVVGILLLGKAIMGGVRSAPRAA